MSNKTSSSNPSSPQKSASPPSSSRAPPGRLSPPKLPAGGRVSSPDSEPRIIPELFQDYNELGHKQSLQELDAAMEEKCKIIVIEPMRLGDETARWIAVGNFLHKSTVLTGLGSMFSSGLLPQRWYIWSPLAFSCGLTYSFYALSWQSDPACRYQVETDPQKLADLRLANLNTHSVVVLTRKNDGRRRILHTGVVALTGIVIGFRAYYYMSGK